MIKRFLTMGLILFLFSSTSLFAAKLPEFTGKSTDLWINSKPLKLADLKGNVVLIEVWTST
ncbi:MAG: hypothetical protein MJE63_13170 [Proteobacteria bacterium]|nr:hypothetical protein [Pseudomonadota bacterium]